MSVEEFLKARKMHTAGIDALRCCDDFLAEMTRGLNGEPSSLVMIPTYMETARELPRGRTVIALDAGGTNLRVAAVTFDADGKALVEDLTRHRMPGTEGEIGKDEFFRALAAYVRPLAGQVGNHSASVSPIPRRSFPTRTGSSSISPRKSRRGAWTGRSWGRTSPGRWKARA